MSSPSQPRAAHPPDTDAWFRTLAETTSTAIFVYRREIIYVNAAGEELTGYTAAELAGVELTRLAHPDFVPFIAQRMQARLSGDMLPAHFDLKIIRKNGEERWIHINSAGLVVDGEPAALGTAVDITDRKLAELELRESRARLELAQRAAGLITWEWDLLTDELRLSDYAAELLGGSPGRIWRSGTEFMAAVTPEDQELVAGALRRCQSGGDTFAVQFRVTTPDGRLRWISERAQVVRDDAGAATRLLGVAHDITSRKQAEEALHQEKELAQVTLASIGDGVIRTDAGRHRRLPEPRGRAADRLDLRRGLRPAGGTDLQRHRRGHGQGPVQPGGALPAGGAGRSSCPATRSCCPESGGDIRDVAIRDSVAPIRDHLGRIAGMRPGLQGRHPAPRHGARDDLPRPPRPADRADQPPRVREAAPALPGDGLRGGPAARPLLSRPRRVQGGQRHLRPPRRRRDAEAGHGAAPLPAAQDRHPRPPGRRRVRRPPGGHPARSARGRSARPCAPRSARFRFAWQERIFEIGV